MRLTMLTTFLVGALSIFGQGKITPVGLIDTSQSYLYIGIDNPIEIDLGRPYENHRVTINNGSLTKIGAGQYVVNVASENDNTMITVILSGSGTTVAIRKFKVRMISEPQFNWQSDSTYNKRQFLSTPFLTLGIPGCYYNFDFKIYSFDVIFDHDASITTYSLIGNSFSQELIQQIKDAKPGTHLTFDNIRTNAHHFDRERKNRTFTIYIE